MTTLFRLCTGGLSFNNPSLSFVHNNPKKNSIVRLLVGAANLPARVIYGKGDELQVAER